MKKNSKTKIISTYAQSLYQAGAETKQTESLFKEVEQLRVLVENEPQIVSGLSNKLLPIEVKKQAIIEVSKKMKLGKELTACLGVLADNGRMAELPGILDEFKHIYYRRHNIEEVEVFTVQALSHAQEQKLKESLEKKLAKKVLINYTIKPELIGGLIVKYGSSMIDDSISGKLNRLEIIMKGGQ